MSLSLQSVRAFVAVAKSGSFGAAAKLLHVSQPTVSAAVARLEAHAGTPLFRRDRTGVSLTEHGQRVLDAAIQLVTVADELDAALTNNVSAEFTLGFMGEAAASVTSQIVAIIRKRLHNKVRLRRFDFDDPTCGLASGESDLAIVWPPLSTKMLDLMVITTDRRAIAFSVSDPLAARETVRPDELSGRDWVVPRSPDPAWVEFRHPKSLGVTDTKAIVESGSVEETLELVASGAGCALVSESTDQHYARAGVVIVPLVGNLRCTAALAWRRTSLHPAIAGILDEVRSLGLPLR